MALERAKPLGLTDCCRTGPGTKVLGRSRMISSRNQRHWDTPGKCAGPMEGVRCAPRLSNVRGVATTGVGTVIDGADLGSGSGIGVDLRGPRRHCDGQLNPTRALPPWVRQDIGVEVIGPALTRATGHGVPFSAPPAARMLSSQRDLGRTSAHLVASGDRCQIADLTSVMADGVLTAVIRRLN